jgi:hypothetical protein
VIYRENKEVPREDISDEFAMIFNGKVKTLYLEKT